MIEHQTDRDTIEGDESDDLMHLVDPDHYRDAQAAGSDLVALCGKRVPLNPAKRVPSGTEHLRPDHCPMCALVHAEEY